MHDAFLKSACHLLTKGEKGEGKGMLILCLLEVFGQVWVIAVVEDLGSMLLTPLLWSQSPEAVCLPSQLCSYSPAEPSLHGPQPSADVSAHIQVHTDVSVCREPARTCFCTAWYILSAALFILRAHYCFLTDVAHLG